MTGPESMSHRMATARPLAVAVLWTFAAVLAGGAIVGLVVLIVGGVAGIVGLFDGGVSASGAMNEAFRIAAWVFAPIGLAAAVWAGAYGTTRQGSLRRTVVAAPVALGVGVALLLLGSSGFLAAGLAIGWALAIPARSPTHVAARAIPLLAGALLVPHLRDLSGPVVIGLLIASPMVAAVAVYLGDLLWSLRRSESAAR